MTELCMVLAKGQNQFFFELAEMLSFELERAGASARISTEGFPELAAGGAYLLLPPHEYFALEGAADPPPPGAMLRTILVCAEQPETIHFRQNLAIAPSAGALFDINARAVRAYRRRGIRAEHLRLGYTELWDRFEGMGERDTDVLFLGAATERRERILAGAAPALSGLETRLVLSDNSRPNTGGSPSYLSGEEKWKALASSRVLLNIHQGEEPYFEWHRVLQAIHAGAAVVTERSTDHEPLRSGTHFVAEPADALAGAVASLAADEARRREIAGAAYQAIRDELPMKPVAERLLEVAGAVGAGKTRAASPLGRVSGALARARLSAGAAASRRR